MTSAKQKADDNELLFTSLTNELDEISRDLESVDTLQATLNDKENALEKFEVCEIDCNTHIFLVNTSL